MSLNPVSEAEDPPDATNIRVSMLKSEKEIEVRLCPVERSELRSHPPCLVGLQSNSADCLNLCLTIETQKDPVYVELF